MTTTAADDEQNPVIIAAKERYREAVAEIKKNMVAQQATTADDLKALAAAEKQFAKDTRGI